MLIKYLLLACIVQWGLVHAVEEVPINKYELQVSVIGGIFEKNSPSRKAFSLAIRMMNECAYDSKLCEQMHACDHDINCIKFHRQEFSSIIVETDDDLLSTFNNFKELTGIGKHEHNFGLATIVGPSFDDMTARYIQGLCEVHDLPNIVTKRELTHDRIRSINLYPDLHTLSHVYVKLVQKLNWTEFSILYEDSDQFLALDNVLKMYPPFGHPIFAFHLGSGPNYNEALLVAKNSSHRNFLLDCHHDHLARILTQIQEVGMMTEKYQYIITSLDLQTVDLGRYQYSGVNISGISMVDLTDPFVIEFVANHLDDLDISDVKELRIEQALTFDSVALFAQAHKDMTYQYKAWGVRLPKDYGLIPQRGWKHGLSMRNYILFNTINGLTGPVMLDSDGSRRRFKLNILNLHNQGLVKAGTWNPDDGFDDLQLLKEMSIRHFKVLITLNPPYAMAVNYTKSLEGNDRYEGFVIDIIKELSNRIGFNYTFYVQEDSSNGVCNKTNNKCFCTGMMEKILNHEMDMAITDLTITEEREQCVDFSTPFWNLGMSILFKKPKKAPPTWHSFLSPFHENVWIYLVGTFMGTSILFFCLGRLNPAEWNNPFPCIEEPESLQNQFTIANSIWFCLGAIMQQGSEIAPIGISTRVLSGCWWFFCLIMVSSYTANLAAFLTVENPVKVIRGIEDLYNQTKIKYGAKKGGSTFMYLQSSSDPKYKQLAEQMQEKEWEQYMVSENKDGINLAKSEDFDYAFIMESSSIEYISQRECDLEQAGPLIDQKSYAIAYKESFEFDQEISRSISKLQESLFIKDLYNKWWKDKGGGCDTSKSNTEPMNLDQLIGVFIVLSIGVVLSCGLTAWELFSGARQESKKENVDLLETLKFEVKYAVKSVKPVLKRRKSANSNESTFGSCDFTMTTQA